MAAPIATRTIARERRPVDAAAVEHFAARLRFETDPADVHAARTTDPAIGGRVRRGSRARPPRARPRAVPAGRETAAAGDAVSACVHGTGGAASSRRRTSPRWVRTGPCRMPMNQGYANPEELACPALPGPPAHRPAPPTTPAPAASPALARRVTVAATVVAGLAGLLLSPISPAGSADPAAAAGVRLAPTSPPAPPGSLETARRSPTRDPIRASPGRGRTTAWSSTAGRRPPAPTGWSSRCCSRRSGSRPGGTRSWSAGPPRAAAGTSDRTSSSAG